jgi:hypothetical protein
MENSNSARGFMAITAFILYLSNAVNEIVVVLASLMIADYLKIKRYLSKWPGTEH